MHVGQLNKFLVDCNNAYIVAFFALHILFFVLYHE